jgi:hypothetical protein
MEAVSDDEYELDFLITPELGGTNDRRNLWPERYSSQVWNARVKDELERLLPQLVCQRKLDVAIAQRDIAANWIAAYKKYFHTSHPLHVSSNFEKRSSEPAWRADARRPRWSGRAPDRQLVSLAAFTASFTRR